MALSREILKISKLHNLNSLSRVPLVGRPENPFFPVLVRTTKHWSPKWKWLRGQKVIPVDLPEFEKKDGSAKERMRTKLKELGIMPPRYWKTRPMTVTTAYEIMEPYEPPEGDGKASILSKSNMTSVASASKGKVSTMRAIRKIKSYDSNFSAKLFPQYAHDLYVKAHTALMNKDPEELSEYVTERALMDMMSNIKNKTLRWKFIESLEAPVVVQARVADILVKTNLFAQVTVRFHTKQCLAIYDRFGRLIFGSEILAKDVLEYAVFEKHINNEYGLWRLHAKIIPNWMSSGSPTAKTYRVEELIEDDDLESDILEEDYLEETPSATETPKESEVKV